MTPLPLTYVTAAAAPAREAPPEFRPLRYETLLGPAAWKGCRPQCASASRRTKRTGAGAKTLHASSCGRWVARLCKLVGSPLPPASDEPVLATVRVEHDPATGGSRWTRRYEFRRRAIEIRSVKSVDAGGHMIERLPMGLRMDLDLHTDDGALHFVTTGYHLEIPRPFFCGAFSGVRCAYGSRVVAAGPHTRRCTAT
jgi:hypothetical protein